MKIYENTFDHSHGIMRLSLYDTETFNLVKTIVSPEAIEDIEAVHGIDFEKFFKAQAKNVFYGSDIRNATLNFSFIVNKIYDNNGILTFTFSTKFEDVDFD